MDYFLTEYKKRCKAEFGEYGFKPYRNNHYRVINDIFQSFCLHRLHYGTDATVEFCVLPLSQEYKIDKSTCGATHLKRFENSAEWFPYVSDDQRSIDSCIEQMILYMRKYLMPFFQKTTTCTDAYETLKIFDVDGAVSYNEYPKLILSLRNHQYLLAAEHLQNIITHDKFAYKRNKEVFGDSITLAYIEKMERSFSKQYKLLALIENKEYKVIQEWLAENERKNKQNLGIKI